MGDAQLPEPLLDDEIERLRWDTAPPRDLGRTRARSNAAAPAVTPRAEPSPLSADATQRERYAKLRRSLSSGAALADLRWPAAMPTRHRSVIGQSRSPGGGAGCADESVVCELPFVGAVRMLASERLGLCRVLLAQRADDHRVRLNCAGQP